MWALSFTMNKFASIVLLLSIPLVCGCIKTPRLHSIQLSTSAKDKRITIANENAIHLADLPIPLGFTLKTYNCINTKTYLCLQGKLPTKKIALFFEADSERNGWRMENLALPVQEIYYLTKPGQKAVIRIEQKISKTLIHVNLKKGYG